MNCDGCCVLISSIFKVEPVGCSIHILALAVLLGYRCQVTDCQHIVETFHIRRRGVASLLLQQVLSQNQPLVTVEVQVIQRS